MLEPKVIGILFTLVGVITFSCFILVTKVTMRKVHSAAAFAGLYSIVAGFLYLFFCFLEKPRVELSPEVIILLLVNIVLYATFGILGNTANKLLDISLTGILSQLSLIFTFIGAVIIFGEIENIGLRIIGVLLILAANILVLLPGKNEVKNWKFPRKGVVFRILAAITISSAMLIDAKISGKFSLALYGAILYFVPGILSILLARLEPNLLIIEIKQNIKGIILSGILSALSYICLLQAFAFAPKSIVASVNNLSSIVIVIFGLIFLKEKDAVKRKILAVIIAFLGALVISNS